MSKLTNNELRKHLRSMSWDALEDIICTLYKESEQANIYFNVHFKTDGFINELAESYKGKIERCFPLSYSGKLKMSEARKYINEIIKLTGNPQISLDLMLHYVECGNKYTQEFGDIDGPFYNSLLSMFDKFVKELNMQNDDTIYSELKERLDALLGNSRNIGWGYSDGIEEIVGTIIWRE